MKILNPSMLRATSKWETFLKKRTIQILLFCFSLFAANTIVAQTVSLKGTITNQNGEPLAGATIQVKGSSIATTTQSDGSFQLEVPQNSTLSISYIGHINKDIKIGSSGYSNLNVQLIADKNELEHVIVVGYGTRKKSDVTGAIVSISEQAIKDIPAANLAQALQGQGAGIDIQKSGGNSKPGATPSILIRGSRSVLAGNNPLFQ